MTSRDSPVKPMVRTPRNDNFKLSIASANTLSVAPSRNLHKSRRGGY